MLTGWTADFFSLMFNDPQANLWDIMDLTTFFDRAGFLMQIELACRTMGGTVRDDRIWNQNLQEGCTLMTFLSILTLITLFS
jgi:hypothetical protein